MGIGWGDVWDATKTGLGIALDPLNLSGLSESPLDIDRKSATENQGIDRGNFQVPGYIGQQARFSNYLKGVDERGAPTLGPDSSFRNNQSALSGLLMDRAQGRNSVAEQQLRQGADMVNQQQRSMMAGARPQNAAMAMRLGSSNMANNMMGLSGATAMARAQESQMAANSLGGLLNTARGQDDARASDQAHMQQNQYSIDDQARQGLLNGSLNAAGMAQQGGMAYEQNRTQRYGADLGVPTKGEILMGGLGGLLSGGL